MLGRVAKHSDFSVLHIQEYLQTQACSMHPNSDFVLDSKPLYKSSFLDINPCIKKSCNLRTSIGRVSPPSNRRLIYGKYGRAWTNPGMYATKKWENCTQRKVQQHDPWTMGNSPPPATVDPHSESVFEKLWLHNHPTRNFASPPFRKNPKNGLKG